MSGRGELYITRKQNAFQRSVTLCLPSGRVTLSLRDPRRWIDLLLTWSQNAEERSLYYLFYGSRASSTHTPPRFPVIKGDRTGLFPTHLLHEWEIVLVIEDQALLENSGHH